MKHPLGSELDGSIFSELGDEVCRGMKVDDGDG